RDLTLLLDVMAGPDPLTLGAAYHLTLPPARHDIDGVEYPYFDQLVWAGHDELRALVVKDAA
ncbi:hypothetical protein ACF082_38070, partial [Streptomyces lydicus]|uniref:hypothetical protein n=1 Tax=Streptomyces lydicus TaxID=47763 RepID=UPI0036F59296